MYAWVDDDLGPFGFGYQLALIRGVTVEDLLTRLDLEPLDHGFTFDEVQGRLLEQGAQVGVADLDGWLLLVRSWAAVAGSDVGVLGDRVLLHYRSVDLDDELRWHVDGRLLLRIAPLSAASERSGDDPDGYLDEMHEAGFDLSAAGGTTRRDSHAAAFALGERLTGVRLSPELLESPVFVIA